MISSYEIKSNQQRNGLWGMPYNCYYIQEYFFDGNDKLFSAIVAAVDEVHNTRFAIKMVSPDGFAVCFAKPVNIRGKSTSIIFINYNDYFLIDKTLFYMNKGDLMKLAFGENYKNIDSTIDYQLASRMRDLSVDPRWYVNDYNGSSAFGQLVNLFEKIGLMLIKRHEYPNWSGVKSMTVDNTTYEYHEDDEGNSKVVITIGGKDRHKTILELSIFDVDTLCELLNKVKYGI